LFLLLYHRYHPWPAFPGTDTASLAVIHIGFKIAILVLFNATFGTIELADTTLDAFSEVIGWSLGTPGPGLILPGTTRLGDNAANLQVLPG
jgi:hypothetical protein